jgi:hypothetical protein
MGTDMIEGFLVAFLVFFVANLVLVIWALIDAIRVPDDSMFKAGNKLVWVIVIVFTGFIGAIVYLAVGRPSPSTRAATPPSSVDPTQLPPPPPVGVG